MTLTKLRRDDLATTSLKGRRRSQARKTSASVTDSPTRNVRCSRKSSKTRSEFSKSTLAEAILEASSSMIFINGYTHEQAAGGGTRRGGTGERGEEEGRRKEEKRTDGGRRRRGRTEEGGEEDGRRKEESSKEKNGKKKKKSK